MIGDHHGRTAGRANLLVKAADEILGTHTLSWTLSNLDYLVAGPRHLMRAKRWWLGSLPAYASTPVAASGSRPSAGTTALTEAQAAAREIGSPLPSLAKQHT